MNCFVTSVGKLSVFVGKACGMFYLAAIALSVYEMFMRYAMDAPTSWTSETIMALVATAWLFCVGAVTQQRRHITVTTMELVVIWLIIGAVSLVGIYNLLGGTKFLGGLLTALDLAPIGVAIIMMIIIFFLGTFLEWIAIVFITVPVFAPVIIQLGYDPVWFGILFAMNIQIYMLSPPFGSACFYLKSVAPSDVTLQEIFLAVLPSICLQIIGLSLVMTFPQIALWLPGL